MERMIALLDGQVIPRLVTFVLGSMVLIDSPHAAWRTGLTTVLPAALLIRSLMLFLMTRVARSRRMRPLAGVEAMVGEIGEAVAPLEPEGKVFVHGEYWNAVTRRALPSGARVCVVKVSGVRLEVEAAGPSLP